MTLIPLVLIGVAAFVGLALCLSGMFAEAGRRDGTVE